MQNDKFNLEMSTRDRLQKLVDMPDEEIDYSDIPELDENFFRNAKPNPYARFDVFLAHNSEDKPAIREIAKQLKMMGVRPWLDEWEIRPGDLWQEKLEEQIERINTAAVFVGQSGIGPWQNLEIKSFLQQFVRSGCRVIPVILSNAQARPQLPIFLQNFHWVDFRNQDHDPIQQLHWGITGEKPTDL